VFCSGSGWAPVGQAALGFALAVALDYDTGDLFVIGGTLSFRTSPLSLYWSSNDGRTFVEVASADLRASLYREVCPLVHRNSVLYVGTVTGVWSSSNASAYTVWRQLTGLLPSGVVVTDITYVARTDGLTSDFLLVGTLGRSIWRLPIATVPQPNHSPAFWIIVIVSSVCVIIVLLLLLWLLLRFLEQRRKRQYGPLDVPPPIIESQVDVASTSPTQATDL
jgi:hypothetical protein